MNLPLWSQYDGMGEQYRQHAEDSACNAHYDRPAVLTELGEVAGKQVLDAACGPGFYALELIKRGAEVTAFDASQSMVDLARTRVGPGIRTDRAVLGEPLPYEDASFDTVRAGRSWCRRSTPRPTGCARVAPTSRRRSRSTPGSWRPVPHPFISGGYP